MAVFNYSFKLDDHFFNVVQIDGGKFDLKINSFFFKDLIEAEEQGVLNHKGKGSNNNEEEDEGNDEEIKNINNNQYKYNKVNKKYEYNNKEEEEDYKKGGDLID